MPLTQQTKICRVEYSRICQNVNQSINQWQMRDMQLKWMNSWRVFACLSLHDQRGISSLYTKGTAPHAREASENGARGGEAEWVWKKEEERKRGKSEIR